MMGFLKGLGGTLWWGFFPLLLVLGLFLFKEGASELLYRLISLVWQSP